MADAPDAPAPRPSRPQASTRPADHAAARPGRPGVVTSAPKPQATQAAPPVVARPLRPSLWAAAEVRRTLVPPCGVLGVAAAGLGGGYFALPDDAVLRQVGPAVPVTLLAVGGLTLAIAGLLIASLRHAAAD